MLATRVATALVVGAIVIAALTLFDSRGWAAFSVAVLVVAGWEWGGLARLGAGGRAFYALVLAVLCWAAARWTGLWDGAEGAVRAGGFYALAAVFWVLAAPLWLARNPQRPPPALVLGCGLAALVPAYLAVLDLRARGIVVFLMIGAIVWIADIAAYFAGRAFGRRKLAPTISPGKSWEGVYGALAGVAVYALAGAGSFAGRIGGAPLAALVAGALVLAGFSVAGDLFESALKRQAGVKDSSRILPGHGGVLDRIDALIPVLPLAALGLAWLGAAGR